MLNLENLLICDGKPTQEFIDYQVDNAVKKMVDSYLYDSDETLLVQDSLLNRNSAIKISDDNLFIYGYSQHFDEVIEGVEKSVARYSPFLKLNPEHEHPTQRKKTKRTPDKITGLRFYLLLEITPEMKSVFLLSRELPEKEQKTTRRPKI